jgi:DNA-directed RNA polymerase specialized sigma24 family protein
MFEPQSELSSDLEWMLESGQVGSDVLAETLVQEYAGQFYRSARLLLWNEAFARQALERALGAALASLYGYRREVGVKVWLYRFLIIECRKSRRESADDLPEVWTVVERQKRTLRELAVLVYAAGLEISEAAKATGISELKARRLLKKLRLNLLLESKYANLDQLGEVGADENKPLKEADIETRLKEIANALTAGWSYEPFSTQEIVDAVEAEATHQGGRKRGFVRFQELLWVGVVIALAGAIIWGSGWLMAGDAADTEAQVTVQTVIVEITPTPQPLAAGGGISQVQPAPKRTVEATIPLNLASDTETIRKRIERAINFRRSLWLDASLRFD